jgi:hypothetical protein
MLSRTNGNPNYDSLVTYLRDRSGEDLRWVASFNAKSYDYNIQYVRPDLKTELTNHEFDAVVHRSIALFRRPFVREVYSHLGPARSLFVEHERATAVHPYISDVDGVIVKIMAGNQLPVPTFVDDCLAALYPDGDGA